MREKYFLSGNIVRLVHLKMVCVRGNVRTDVDNSVIVRFRKDHKCDQIRTNSAISTYISKIFSFNISINGPPYVVT
jgi:hypothetical protein